MLARLRKTDNVAVSTADEAETSARVAESELREAQVTIPCPGAVGMSEITRQKVVNFVGDVEAESG